MTMSRSIVTRTNCNALTSLEQPHGFELEFERVSRYRRFRHFRIPCVNLNTQQGIRLSGARSNPHAGEDMEVQQR
jgi:hypothetical protein